MLRFEDSVLRRHAAEASTPSMARGALGARHAPPARPDRNAARDTAIDRCCHPARELSLARRGSWVHPGVLARQIERGWNTGKGNPSKMAEGRSPPYPDRFIINAVKRTSIPCLELA